MFARFVNVAKLPQQEWVLCLSDERVAQAVCPEMAPRLKGFFSGLDWVRVFLAELSWAEGTLARQEHWWAHSLHWWWQQEGKGTKFQSSSVTEWCLNSLTFCDVNFQTWIWKKHKRLNQDCILQHSYDFMAPQTRVVEHQAKKKKGKEAFGLKWNEWSVGTWATGTIFWLFFAGGRTAHHHWCSTKPTCLSRGPGFCSQQKEL